MGSVLLSLTIPAFQVAAKTLGDLVRKLGERVLPEIIPILEKGLESEEPDQRQGVCIGLSEMMASTSRDMVLTFVNSLVPTVRYVPHSHPNNLEKLAHNILILTSMCLW